MDVSRWVILLVIGFHGFVFAGGNCPKLLPKDERYKDYDIAGDGFTEHDLGNGKVACLAALTYRDGNVGRANNGLIAEYECTKVDPSSGSGKKGSEGDTSRCVQRESPQTAGFNKRGDKLRAEIEADRRCVEVCNTNRALCVSCRNGCLSECMEDSSGRECRECSEKVKKNSSVASLSPDAHNTGSSMRVPVSYRGGR